MATEPFEALVVGARCAGSGAAIALARAGRRVLAIDRATFPSDTLSTHANFPSAVVEMRRLGVLDRVLALNPPRCCFGMVEAQGVRCRERFSPYKGIDYGLSVPRPEFDLALVETAREAGAEVRERTTLLDVHFADGRVSGARLRERDGREYDVSCRLIVGADGRRSTVAKKVGADVPYRGSRNGRGAAFWYLDDPLVGTDWQRTLIQYRMRETHALIFPCPGDQLLLLYMGPAADIARFRSDPDGMWEQMLAENPPVAERVAGHAHRSKVRSTAETTAFFRHSSGSGWALTGDAGHFKDPIIGQGMRDAMRFGRLLGEAAAPVLEDPATLDAALREVERRRDFECLPTYHWGNRESRVMPPSAIVHEALRWMNAEPRSELLRLFDRTGHPQAVLSPWRGARWATRALLRPGADRKAILAEALEEVRIDTDLYRERLLARLGGQPRITRPSADERTDYSWPARAVSRTEGILDEQPAEVAPVG
ncbi:MAG TPA: NAD(P)/FAD-dependent oxidoreductase [Solirubrobacteraceae bacterium]|jgi:flavin-dependent dehydrogenase|nr:NAD(P)/FAD-dependent oxidoreductase [Solirubrobacteraceae bacterium]